jgi:hypothetical protein
VPSCPGNTAWGLYNAVTEYIDHVRPAEIAKTSKSEARKERAFTSAIFGDGDLLKLQALAPDASARRSVTGR